MTARKLHGDRATTTIRFPERLLSKIDALAKDDGLSRSEWMIQALTRAANRKPAKPQPDIFS